MNTTLKGLVLASPANLFSNSLGTVIAWQHNLTANFGGFLNGQDVPHDFLTLKGTALSAPRVLLLLQLGLTGLAPRPGRSGTRGVAGVALMGAGYILAQLGEPIVLRLWRPGGFDLAQALVLGMNILTALAMLALGVSVWRTRRAAG